MSDELIKLQETIVEFYNLGVIIDVQMVNQVKNGNIEDIILGFIPIFTYTDYIQLEDNDWIQGDSFNTIEEAIRNGIKRAEKRFKVLSK